MGKKHKNIWITMVTQYSLNIFTLSRALFILPDSHCALKGIPQKWNAGHANRNRHTKSSWHFNYISFHFIVFVCDALFIWTRNTHTHKHTCTHWKRGNFQIKPCGALRFLGGELWFKSDDKVHIFVFGTGGGRVGGNSLVSH